MKEKNDYRSIIKQTNFDDSKHLVAQQQIQPFLMIPDIIITYGELSDIRRELYRGNSDDRLACLKLSDTLQDCHFLKFFEWHSRRDEGSRCRTKGHTFF
jgi:hypothetical protein